MNPNQALQAAIKFVGGPSELARLLSTTPQNVSGWIHNKNKRVPVERCGLIERLTGITRRELRPDFDWGEIHIPSKRRKPASAFRVKASEVVRETNHAPKRA